MGDVAYVVYRIPGMARVQLVRQEGASLKPIAGFRDEWDAREFAKWLKNIAEVVNDGGLQRNPLG